MPYVPGKLPTLKDSDAQALAQYFEDELIALASSLIQNIQVVDLSPSTVAPLRPRTGVVVYADGTHFDPGGGEGAYVYGSDAAWHSLSNRGGIKVVFQTITASGLYIPTPGMSFCMLEGVGGGAGGGGASSAAGSGGAGGGGGGGSYARKLATAAAIGVSQIVTIAAVANGGAAGNNPGTAGGDTSIGALCIGKGGSPGSGSSGGGQPVLGGAGGVAGTGDFKSVGNSGGIGFSFGITTIFSIAGYGGNGPFGGGATVPVPVVAGTAGLDGSNYGSGGSGASSYNGGASAAGGKGSQGVALITEFILI